MKKKTIFKFKSLTCKLLSAIFLSVCIISFISVHHLFAEVPCKINYQGRLIEDNVPVDGTKTMKFTIYNSAAGGDELWTSGNVDITVYNGLFRYVIGSDGGDLSTLDWTAGQELYLEVIVDGETLTPLEAIYAYPYAINSHLLEGATKEYFLNTSGDTQTKQGDLNIMGNVGIGTTGPNQLVELASAITGGQGAYSNHPVLRLTQAADPATIYQRGDVHSAIEFYTEDTGNWWPAVQAAIKIQTTRAMGQSLPDAGIAFWTADSDAVLTERMIIEHGGNVGIGTTSPGAKLEVDGDILSDTVGYDSEGAYRYCKINGNKTKVYTKYLTGTLETSLDTNVPHGVTNTANILAVSCIIYSSNSSWYYVGEIFHGTSLDRAVYIVYDANDIKFKSVGSWFRGQVYRIRIDYIL